MNYIVLDLEWNQGTGGKGILWAEIIEIGAVKVNEVGEVIDTFSRLIRPVIYPEINKYAGSVIPVDEKELEQGTTFVDGFSKFIEWCGNDYMFCTWGAMDLTELQKNIDYYGIKNPFPFPLYYYDIQEIYSMYRKEEDTIRSLDYAVEQLGIEIKYPFHRAMWDAYYTAKVMEQLPFSNYVIYKSIDYHRTPRTRKEEIYKVYPTYSIYVTREFSSIMEAMKEKRVTSSVCYFCGKPIKKSIDWFSVGGKIYYCTAYCSVHGWMRGKLRVKKGRSKGENTIFIIKTIQYVTEHEAEEVKERQQEIKEKRKERRKLMKETKKLLKSGQIRE